MANTYAPAPGPYMLYYELICGIFSEKLTRRRAQFLPISMHIKAFLSFRVSFDTAPKSSI
jgi:hypothetical protein